LVGQNSMDVRYRSFKKYLNLNNKNQNQVITYKVIIVLIFKKFKKKSFEI
jgi:hypothetical protein